MSTYIQRQINTIFRVYRKFVKIYVNNIIVFSQTLKKHIKHFTKIFVFFDQMNIVLKSFKIFLRYSFVSLLKQKIDSLRLTIAKKKLKAILSLKFFLILKHLETYLKKTNYFRQYVLYYVQKFDNFQKRKTRLLKNVFFKNKSRQKYSFKTIVNNSFEKKLDFFNQLQSIFNRFSFLIYFDRIKSFFLNINVFKKKEFEICVYHIKKNFNFNEIKTLFKRDDLKSIMFLNKMLFSAEIRYWSTKFEIIAII